MQRGPRDRRDRPRREHRTTTMRTRTRTTLFILLAVSGLAAAPGCDPPDVADPGPADLRPGGGFGCTWCGGTLGNSPRVNDASLADIHLDESNGDGVKLCGLSSPQN